MSDRKNSESGVMVYPRMPVPKPNRESDPKIAKGKGRDKKLMAMLGGAAVAGIILGFVVRPIVAKDSRIGTLETKVTEVQGEADKEKARADNLQKRLGDLGEEKQSTDSKLTEAEKAQKELAAKAAEAEAKVKESEAAQAKLKAVIDKSIGTISADGEEIRLQLIDKVLFKTGEDQLTDNGKKVLDRVAGALKELPDKQVWVQGHTDDQPIYIAPKPPPPKLKRGQKPPPVKPEDKPDGRFATNWELSAARALTVVHYLQDVHKLDGSRLAALAFGQYRPLSRTNKAANRRIEIVLYPKPSLRKQNNP